MKISTKGHYAVQALVDLAVQPTGSPVSLASISARQDISLNYLEQLFLKLRKAELVKSVRGPGGGYLLGKEPSQISIGEIFEAVDENIILSDCVDDTAQSACSKTQNCLTQLLWSRITSSLKKTLYSISLAEVSSETFSAADGVTSDKPSFIYQL